MFVCASKMTVRLWVWNSLAHIYIFSHAPQGVVTILEMRQVLSLSGHIFPSLIPHTHSPSSGSLLDKSAESPAEVLWWQVVSATDDRLYKHISHAGCSIPGQTQHIFDTERDCTHLSRGCVKNCVRFKNDGSFWCIHPCHNVPFGGQFGASFEE